jgi:chorismate mutase/prephenate dehydratase
MPPRKPPADLPASPAAAAKDPASKARAAIGAAPAAEAKKPPGLTEMRGEIDRLDKELVDLLNRRAEVSVQIGQIKQKQGLDVWSSAREEEVVNRALSLSKGPLLPETLRLVFRELMSGSRALQRPLKVAFLGPKYSYSHLASVARFGESVEHCPVGSIAAVFEEVNRRHVHFGIVPLENSTDGRIADTLDQFVRLPGLKIRAEVRLGVHHCLLGRGERSQIRRVYSKAQALSQCRNWLGKNLPQATLVEVVSTSHAAEIAQREDGAAAIASRQAGEAYRLELLTPNIEDQPHNLTRFAVIAERPEQRTGKDKTTLMLRLPNSSGALGKAIAPFEKNGVNMTWIESFPYSEGPAEANPTYLFFVDIEGHAEDDLVRRTLDAVRKKCDRLEVLGSYPRAECVER